MERIVLFRTDLRSGLSTESRILQQARRMQVCYSTYLYYRRSFPVGNDGNLLYRKKTNIFFFVGPTLPEQIFNVHEVTLQKVTVEEKKKKIIREKYYYS